MEERKINLVDVLVEILLHWRMFIVCMLIGAVLLGGFSYVRGQQQQTEKEKFEQPPEDWLTEEEMQNVNSVVTYERAYLSKVEYIVESPFMKIDANNVSMGEAIIVIDAQDHLTSCDIEKVYEGIVRGSELISEMAEEFDMEKVSVGEMIVLNGLTVESNDTWRTENTNSFKIVVMDSEEGRCQAILEAAIAFLRGKQSNIESVFGEHELIVGDKSYCIISNTAVADRQQKVLNDIESMKNILSAKKDKLSDVERQYYDLLTSGAEMREKSVSETVPVPGISIKYVILGMAVAAFLYAFVLFMAYISSPKVCSTDNLQELYSIPQLGMIPAGKNHRRIFGFVDRWILWLRNYNKKQFTPEEALRLASVAIKMAAGKETLSEICLVGCGLKGRSLDVCEKIKTQLKEENIHINILNNVLYDAQTMGELEKEKGAVLVESAGSTLYQEITRELEILNRQGIKVLGGILVE